MYIACVPLTLFFFFPYIFDVVLCYIRLNEKC